MRKKMAQAAGFIKEHRIAMLVLGLFVLLAAAARMQDVREAESFQGIVAREPESGEAKTQRFLFRLEEETADLPEEGKGSGPLAEEIGEQELDLEVSPLLLEREEAFALLRQAAEEWEEEYLGTNVSANEVRHDLYLPETLCDGLVTVTYESSDYEVLLSDGAVKTDNLPAQGEVVELTARFSYGDYTQIETAALLVLPLEEGSAEWIVSELTKEAQTTEEESREQETFSLPEEVGPYRVIWERAESTDWIFYLLLGGVAVFCLEWRGRQQEKNLQKKRAARLEFEYPQMVDQFAVLLESGMTIRKAWERILIGGRRAEKKGAKKSQGSGVYLEEMWITYREIREGRGEREAYERFGNRIGLMPYKKFSSILTQNLSKGTRDVKELLQRESEEALEMRKSRARKMGEEAGTKMLFPMLVVMMLILLVLLMPALTNL